MTKKKKKIKNLLIILFKVFMKFFFKYKVKYIFKS